MGIFGAFLVPFCVSVCSLFVLTSKKCPLSTFLLKFKLYTADTWRFFGHLCGGNISNWQSIKQPGISSQAWAMRRQCMGSTNVFQNSPILLPFSDFSEQAWLKFYSVVFRKQMSAFKKKAIYLGKNKQTKKTTFWWIKKPKYMWKPLKKLTVYVNCRQTIGEMLQCTL